MINSIIILSLLFIADRRLQTRSAVGYADSIVPGAKTRVFRNTKDAVDFAADSDMAGGTFQGEIEIVQDGYAISNDLAELAETSTFETTKGGLRRALSALKKKTVLLSIQQIQHVYAHAGREMRCLGGLMRIMTQKHQA